MKLNALQRLPIGALIEKPAAPLLEEFSVVPGQGSVQFERALAAERDAAQEVQPACAA